MVEQGYGKIITVGSVMSELGMPGALHYVTTKAGLVGFTRALAREVGRSGVRVNAVLPGAIRTEHELETVGDQEALAAAAAARQCLPDRGRPADLVGTFVFLAAADSDFVTGQVLAVDGGWVHR
jgi:3-oxoacyl-[acyl-carrier protein] reductase